MHSNFTGIARQLQFSSPFLRLNVSDIMKLILHSRAIAPSGRITPGNDVSICQNRRKCTEGSLNLFYTSRIFQRHKRICAKMKQNNMGMAWDFISWDMLGLERKSIVPFQWFKISNMSFSDFHQITCLRVHWAFCCMLDLISLENFLRHQAPKLFVGADLRLKKCCDSSCS